MAIESGSALQASRELWDLRTARSTKRLSGLRLAPPATLSADGRQLAGRALAGRSIEVWSFEKNAVMLTVPDEGFGSQFAFAGPDRLVTLSSSAGKSQLTTWDIATGQPIHQIDNLSVGGMPVIAVSPGGKFLVCGTSRRLELIDLDAGRLLASFQSRRSPAGSLRFEACAFPPTANCWLACLWNQADCESSAGSLATQRSWRIAN